jgi:hypothetical protein
MVAEPNIKSIREIWMSKVSFENRFLILHLGLFFVVFGFPLFSLVIILKMDFLVSAIFTIGVCSLVLDGILTHISIRKGNLEIAPISLIYDKIGKRNSLMLTRGIGILLLGYGLIVRDLNLLLAFVILFLFWTLWNSIVLLRSV